MLKECPICKQITLKITYDNPSSDYNDTYDCENPDCRWRG